MSIIFPNYRLARLSWGAVFAGVFLSLIVYLILSVLGTAIGASSLAPLSDQYPLHGFAFGTGVWVMFTTVASILVGAYMAGRSAPSEGWLHGLLTWSIVTLVTVYLASVLVGGALGAVFSVAKGGLTVAGQAAATAAPGMVQGAQNALDQNGLRLNNGALQSQLQGLLTQNGQSQAGAIGSPASAASAGSDAQPISAMQQTSDTEQASDAQAGSSQTTQSTVTLPTTAGATPQSGNADLAAWWARVQQQPQPGISPADQDALTNIIMAHTGKDHADAAQAAAGFVQTYNQSVAQAEQAKQAAQQKAREAAAATAHAVARGSWWGFALLIVGGIVAAAAGTLGSRHQPVEEELVVDDREPTLGGAATAASRRDIL